MIKIELIHEPVSWLAHAGYGKRSFNPRFKEKDFVCYHVSKQYNGEVLEGPVSVTYDFYLPIPSSISKKQKAKILSGEILHVKRKDCTNMVKFYEDCIKGIVFRDDSQVVESIARKHYSEQPRVLINIRRIE